MPFVYSSPINVCNTEHNHLFVCVFVCVCVRLCVWLWCVCMCMCVHGWYMCGRVQNKKKAAFALLFALLIWKCGPLNWKLVFLARELSGSACLCPLNLGSQAYSFAQIFTWVLGIQTHVLMFAEQMLLLMNPSLQPLVLIMLVCVLPSILYTW